MVREKNKAWWPEQDVCKALTLLIKSKAAYEHVREKIPLPSIRTIGRHLAQIPFNEGIICPVVNLMKSFFANTLEMFR